MPDEASRCLHSWNTFLTGYEITEWNESNSPMHLPYMQRALQERKWANLSNLVRLHALLEHGGWYFDTDVELIRDPRHLERPETCVVGLESRPWSGKWTANNAVIWSPPNHPFIRRCYEQLLATYDGTEMAHLSSPVLTTDCLKSWGFAGSPMVKDGVELLPYDVFYPSPWYAAYKIGMETQRTVAVHHNDASWQSPEQFTGKELSDIVKGRARYKETLGRYQKGYISWKEFLALSARFFKRRVSNL